jgi:prolyl 4-hydroxylase
LPAAQLLVRFGYGCHKNTIKGQAAAHGSLELPCESTRAEAAHEGGMRRPNDTRSVDVQFQAMVHSRHGNDPQALADLGTRLVAGRDAPLAPADGAALILEAAHAGNALACARAAVLAASGIGREQSWTDAFECLHTAADRGSLDAARQLDLLGTLGVQDSRDVEAWLVPPDRKVVHENPRLCAYANFLPPPLCAHLVDRALPMLSAAKVYDARAGGLKSDAMRTNRTAPFSLIDTDVVMHLVRARIAKAAGVDSVQLEPLEVLHYAPGERYRPHVDFFHPALPSFAAEMRNKGQRVKTCLVYLNDDYDGGETEFPKINVKFRGRAGEALVFDNVQANGSGNMNTLHEGLPPTRGEKWLLSQWIRNKAQPIA